MPSITNRLSSQILKKIKKSQNILLHCHPSPDGDSLGSVLAIAEYLKQINKEVTIIKGDSELPSNFDHLPNFSTIENKSYFDIDPSAFDLFLILDTADKNQISKIGPVSFPPDLNTVVIDHHASNPGFADIYLIDDTSPSTCQIVSQLLSDWKANITVSMATNLIIGIYTDTGGFKYPKTTSRTFEIIAKLTSISPNYSEFIFQMENRNDPGQIRFRAVALNNLKEFFSNHVVFSSVSRIQMKKNNISRNHTEKSDIANLLKSVEGWDIAVSIVETDPGVSTISLRTRDPKKYDLSQIALATGSGGGHPAAAGATLKKSIKGTQQKLIEIIQKLHPELGKP